MLNYVSLFRAAKRGQNLQQTKDASKEQPKKGNHISVSLYLNAGVAMKLMGFIWIFIIDKIVMMEPFEAICDPQLCCVYSNKHTHLHHIRNSFKGFLPFRIY